MRNKQEDREALAQSQNYYIISINGSWWEESCDRCAVMGSYKLFRRDRQDKQGVGVLLDVMVGLDCMELATGDEVEILLVSIKGEASKANVVVGSNIGHLASMTIPMNYSIKN